MSERDNRGAMAMIKPPYIFTHTGVQFPLIYPGRKHVDWRDIAYALSNINRFTGHAGLYSVAQHSGIVWEIVTETHPELGLEALLHDAHEAYLGDWSTPLKNALWVLGNSAGDELQNGVDRGIRRKAGLADEPTREAREIVKHADLVALATEKRDLFKRQDPTPWPVLDGIEASEKMIVRMTPSEAYESFLGALEYEGIDVLGKTLPAV